MSLYNLKLKLQPEIGIKIYWNNFRRFRDTPLHRAIVSEIKLFLKEKSINSRQLGNKILNKIEKNNPALIRQEPADELGSLFGMTLWNELANDTDNWKFHKISINSLVALTGTIYFK